MHIVVLYDPSGKHAEGEILTANAAEVAKSRGVATLPIVPQLLRDNAFAGYAKRAYGRGWTFDAQKAGRGCPLALHVDAEYPTIHWAARILADGPARIDGTLRMATDTAQMNASAIGLAPKTAPIQLAALGDPDANGGWTIGGSATASIPGAMFIGLQLYGMAQNVRVLWFAASQSV